MKFRPLQEVFIIADTFGFGIPQGAMGIVMEVSPHPLTALNYLIRFPDQHRSYWLPESDLQLYEEVLASNANDVIAEALIDFALATRNRVLFESHTVFKEW